MKTNASRRHDGEILVIVDLQRAFAIPAPIVDGIRRFAERFDQRVFTRFVNPEGSLFRRLLKLEACPPGSPDTALQIVPKPGDLVFRKSGYGLSPSHLNRLRRKGVKRAVVCGVDTDACVLAVMFSLFDARIDCRVQPNLCWSSTGLHREGMRIIDAQFPKPKRGAR